MNDTQSGRVIVNWQFTAVLLVALQVVVGFVIGIDLVLALAVGLLVAGAWLFEELYNWDSTAVRAEK